MKFHRDTLKLIAMMRRGQLIVSGGGISVKQLPSGQYQLSMTTGDLTANQGRTPSPGNPNGPGVPHTPFSPPPDVAGPPPDPGGVSGPYGGGIPHGRTIRGVGWQP